MERNHLEGVLADLRGKFELVLEDYAALHVELQALRREAHERHELITFLLKAVAVDLASHRSDAGAHRPFRASATGRPTARSPRFAACPPPQHPGAG